MDIFNLILALLINLVIAIIETIVLLKVTQKRNIFKFYTFLSNIITLITSIIFVIVDTIVLFSGNYIPIWVKGLRFASTHLLATTLLVFTFILVPLYKKGTVKNEIKLFTGISEKNANILLHYICPILSIISFLLFERDPILKDSQWTLYAALPSIIYWLLYFILTITKCWKDPYGLMQIKKSKTKNLKGIILLILIPLISVGIDYLLWWINTF